MFSLGQTAVEHACASATTAAAAKFNKKKSGDPESNRGPADVCTTLQSDALPTELSPVLVPGCSASGLVGRLAQNAAASFAAWESRLCDVDLQPARPRDRAPRGCRGSRARSSDTIEGVDSF